MPTKQKGWAADLSGEFAMKWTVTFENEKLKTVLSKGSVEYFILKCFECPPITKMFNVEHNGIGRVLISLAGIEHKDGFVFNFFISEVK